MFLFDLKNLRITQDSLRSFSKVICPSEQFFDSSGYHDNCNFYIKKHCTDAFQNFKDLKIYF